MIAVARGLVGRLLVVLVVLVFFDWAMKPHWYWSVAVFGFWSMAVSGWVVEEVLAVEEVW